MPVSNTQIVLGKFFAAWAVAAVAVLSTLLFAISIATVGPLDWGPVLTGYLGMLLFTGAMLAIGLLCSAFTVNQVVAFLFALIICGVLYMLSFLKELTGGWVGQLADLISLSSRMHNMARGVVDSRDLIYYLSLMGGALFLAERALARQRA